MYILVRQNLSPEMQVVQAAHAAIESAYRFPKADDDTFLVVLGVPDADALEAAHERITRKGIRSYLFYEPDRALGHTALATEPVIGSSKRKVFFPYPILQAQALHADVA